MNRTAANCVLFAATLLVSSCGSETSNNGRIRQALSGTVTYEGSFTGTLEVSVFGAFPPRGPAVSVERIKAPTFPHAYAFDQLPPGRYFVLAMLDQNEVDGPQFHPTIDPGGAHGGFTSPVSVRVEATTTTARVDIELVDPSSDSPWIRRNYR